MNKKGNSYWILIFSIVFIFLLFFAVFKLLDKYNKISKNKAIGERQEELLRLYQRGEKFLLYNDQAARLSGQQALYDYAKNGGMKSATCGTYKGYAVWDFTNNCFAKEEELHYYFSTHMDQYASRYLDKQVRIPTNNYIYVIRPEPGKMTLVGIATDPITIEVKR